MALAGLGWSGRAEAAGIEGCFREAESFALCNGFLAGIGGAVGVALGSATLVSPEPVTAGAIAGTVATGLYAGASGGALLASGLAMDSASTLRDTSIAVGLVDLGLSGAALVLSALGGVRAGWEAHRDDGEDEDDEEARRWSLGPMVAGGPEALAAGLSFRLSL